MKNQETNQMTNTIITISDDVQEKINELKEDNFYEGDMIEFIQVYGNDNFLAYYEDYVKYGEEYCYEAVDAFVDEFGIDAIANFCDAYFGEYDSEEQFAQEYVAEHYIRNLEDLPVVIDWEKTWNCNLRYDFSFNDGYVFLSNF
jgi:antirestriction protein